MDQGREVELRPGHVESSEARRDNITTGAIALGEMVSGEASIRDYNEEQRAKGEGGSEEIAVLDVVARRSARFATGLVQLIKRVCADEAEARSVSHDLREAAFAPASTPIPSGAYHNHGAPCGAEGCNGVKHVGSFWFLTCDQAHDIAEDGAQAMIALERRSGAREGSDVAPLRFVSLVSDPVESLPLSAILPGPPTDAPTAEEVAHVRNIMGGTPLDVCASLLAHVEERRSTAANGLPVDATDRERLAIAKHLEETARALLAGTPHRRSSIAPSYFEKAQTEIARLQNEVDAERAALAKVGADLVNLEGRASRDAAEVVRLNGLLAARHADGATVTSERNALRATVEEVRNALVASALESTTEAAKRLGAEVRDMKRDLLTRTAERDEWKGKAEQLQGFITPRPRPVVVESDAARRARLDREDNVDQAPRVPR